MGINKEEMLVVLKDLADWNLFLVEVEKATISTFTDDKKQSIGLELLDLVVKLVTDAIPSLSTAIEGSANIPEQWKAASTMEKTMFFVTLTFEHTKAILSAIFDKPAVETPAV